MATLAMGFDWPWPREAAARMLGAIDHVNVHRVVIVFDAILMPGDLAWPQCAAYLLLRDQSVLMASASLDVATAPSSVTLRVSHLNKSLGSLRRGPDLGSDNGKSAGMAAIPLAPTWLVHPEGPAAPFALPHAGIDRRSPCHCAAFMCGRFMIST